jgi:hypothetical protein
MSFIFPIGMAMERAGLLAPKGQKPLQQLRNCGSTNSISEIVNKPGCAAEAAKLQGDWLNQTACWKPSPLGPLRAINLLKFTSIQQLIAARSRKNR